MSLVALTLSECRRTKVSLCAVVANTNSSTGIYKHFSVRNMAYMGIYQYTYIAFEHSGKRLSRCPESRYARRSAAVSMPEKGVAPPEKISYSWTPNDHLKDMEVNP